MDYRSNPPSHAGILSPQMAPCAAQEISPIFRRLDQVQSRLIEVHDLADSLKFRLTPVRSAPKTAKENPPALQPECSCPFEENLYKLQQDVDCIKFTLKDLLDELRL